MNDESRPEAAPVSVRGANTDSLSVRDHSCWTDADMRGAYRQGYNDALNDGLALLWHKRAEDADYRARRGAHKAAWTGRGFRQTAEDRADIEADWQRWVGGAS